MGRSTYPAPLGHHLWEVLRRGPSWLKFADRSFFGKISSDGWYPVIELVGVDSCAVDDLRFRGRGASPPDNGKPGFAKFDRLRRDLDPFLVEPADAMLLDRQLLVAEIDR